MTNQAVEVHQAGAPATTVGAREWNLMQAQAAELSKSDIIPQAYRRKAPNIIMAALTGRHHGWDVITAMRNGHVIEGTWGMKPEAMLGLVRQAGHSVSAEMLEDGARVTGKRGDNGDTMTFSFTYGDAVRANLCQMKDGRPFARSTNGKALPWEQYPQMMCYWRAVGSLCRMLFSDVTLGAHTVDELGGRITADGEIVDDDQGDDGEVEVEIISIAQELSVTAIGEFRKACAKESLSADAVLARAFPDGVPKPLTDDHLPAMRDAFAALKAEKQTGDESDIVDAEVVDEPPPPREDVKPASRKQVGAVKGQYARVGIPGRDEQLLYTADVLGRPVESHNQLDEDEVRVLLDHLSSLPDAGEADE